MDTVAVAKLGQPWSEAKAMGTLERRAFLYCAAILNGATVDWGSGQIKPPKRPE